jgi:hypothetical protein
MQWETETIAEVARAYRIYYELGQGGRQERLAAEEHHFWAWRAVSSAVMDGTLPIEVIDALLNLPPDDEAFWSYVAAGPIEDMLTTHPDQYTDAVAHRCQQHTVWARAVGGVWLDRHTWDLLPEPLRSLITRPATPQQAQRSRVRTKRRPSKRQSHRGRRR